MLKSFDVDDTTEDRFDRVGSQYIIDLNGRAGDDNFTDSLGTPKAGKFVVGGLQTLTTTLGANGEALVEFQVGMQPGNNYRIAATVIPVNNLALLQAGDPAANYFVSAYTDTVKGGFNGALSPVLTVWRKLYLEVDSMLAVPTTGAQINYMAGSAIKIRPNYPVAGQTTVSINRSSGLTVSAQNMFENGQLSTVSSGTYNIKASYIRGSGADVVVVGIVPNSTTSVTITDDDERNASSAHLPRLPMDTLSGNIINGLTPFFSGPRIPGMLDAYERAFIQVVDANAAGLNTRRNLSFFVNKDVFDSGTTGVFDSVKDVTDSIYFWAHTVTFGFQPAESEDDDPNTELGLLGVTAEHPLTSKAYGYSAIYNETIRDQAIEIEVSNGDDRTNERNTWKRLIGTCAHETGHPPGSFGENSDHGEGGMMDKGGRNIAGNLDFSPKSILRFRKSASWTNGYP